MTEPDRSSSLSRSDGENAAPERTQAGSGIEVCDLFWQPKNAAAPILDHLSASFEEGRFYALLGPNGAGKTSFLRCLPGFQKADSGTILLGGRKLEQMKRKDIAHFTAYLPQNSENRLELPVRDILEMARYSRLSRFAQPSAEDRKAIAEAVQLCGCEGLLERNFALLSGGERQRVLCCRAIAQESPWILLDEPVSNLDLRYQHEILRILRERVGQRRVSVIAVMHDLSLCWRYFDEILLMKSGRLQARGRKEAVLQDAVLSEVYDIPIYGITAAEGRERLFLVGD